MKLARKLGLALAGILISSIGFSQSINMSNGTFNQCGGTIYDPGGTANYANNQDITTTLCPSNPGQLIRLDFTLFDTEAGFDFLDIHDGPTTASPLLASYDGSVLPFSVIASTANGGCITLHFTSDGSTVAPGFAATISCVYPCQPVVANVNSSNPAFSNGIIETCIGTPITVQGSGTYSAATPLYTQSDATSSFNWDFGDGTFGVGQNVTKVFFFPGVYDLDLNVTDVNGCESPNDINFKVRVSDTVGFVGTNAAQQEICLGQTNTLTGFVQEKEIELFCYSELPDTTFIPDGVGVSYASPITIDCFDPTTNVTAASNIQSICLDLEHSYIADLEITISCPNGTTIDLFIPPLTGVVNSVQVGEPVDDDNSLTMGDTYNYCFQMGAAQTWNQVAYPTIPPPLGTIPTHSYTDNNGTAVNNVYYIPAGNYLPQETFANLVGCPLNGDWTISVTDVLSSDNGYLTGWSINFDTSLYTTQYDYTPTIDDTMWLSDPTIISNTGTQIVVQPTSVGQACYVYQAEDEFGCIYDTTICFNVVPGEDSTFSYAQSAYCLNAANPTPTIGLAGGTFSATPAGLSINPSTGQVNLGASTPGTYAITYVSPGIGCQTQSTQMFTVSGTPTATISGSNTICQGQTTPISIALTGASPWDIVYNDGTSNQTVTGITSSPYVFNTGLAGNYTLVSVQNAACSGTVSGSAVVVVNQTVSTSNLQATCNPATNDYNVTFQLNGGDPASYSVTGMTGGTISMPSPGVYVFTSNGIPEATTSYSYTFNDANNCNTITVSGSQFCNCNASANLSGGGSICPGDSAMFTVTFTGDGPFDFTYANANGNTSFTGVSSPFTFYDSIAGSYSLVAMNDTLCSGSVGGSGSITFNTVPTVSINEPTICQGQTANLNATTNVSGGTYAWSPGAFGNSQSISVTPPSSQYYYLTYTLNGCSVSDSALVTVNPQPSIVANDTSICNGGSAPINTSVTVAGGTYMWSPGGQMTPTITVSPTSTTNYTVTYTLNGCTSSDVATVTVATQPSVNVTNRTICQGDSARMIATVNNQGGTYSWSTAAGPVGVNNDTIFVSPMTTTVYTVTYSIGACSDTDSGTVTVNFTPTVTLADTSLCEGGSVQITAMVDSLGGGYTWSPGNLPSTQSVTVSPATTTTYKVVYQLGLCKDSTTNIVTVTPTPSVSVNSPTICAGDSATLTANGSPNGGTYTWDYMNATTQSITVGPTTTTNYNVLYNLNGCLVTSGGTVTVTPLPNTSISGTDSLCRGDNLLLTAGPNGGTYSWTGPNGYSANNQTINIPNMTVGQAGYYYATANVNNCSNTDTILVVVNFIDAAFDSDVTTGCIPLTVNFNNLSANSVNCTWDFGNGDTDMNCTGVSSVYTAPGTYDVTLTVVDQYGCSDVLTQNDYITVEPNPIPNFDLEPDQVLPSAPITNALNTSLGATSYEWYVNGAFVSDVTNPILTIDFNDQLTANVTLYAYSDAGCVDSITKQVSLIEEVLFFIPNTFTPDGDIANQYFFPVMTSGFDESTYQMTIFNRWGETVFITEDINVGWDGTNGANELCPDGVYTYKITFLLKDTDERQEHVGIVNLLR